MTLLIDANISWRLVQLLNQSDIKSIHVDQSGLTVPASDTEIWDYAKANNFIIVTNDEDFQNLVNLKGFPPKVLLLKTGNQRTIYLSELIIKHKESILEFYHSSEIGLLEIFSK
jgi:predicted nuclease of predicted toxin-antitoxin system